MQQEVVLALLAKEPSHGSQLRARLRQALGPLGEAMNDGQVYVTLARLEKAGEVVSERAAGAPDRPDRKTYALTAHGQQRVSAYVFRSGRSGAPTARSLTTSPAFSSRASVT